MNKEKMSSLHFLSQKEMGHGKHLATSWEMKKANIKTQILNF